MKLLGFEVLNYGRFKSLFVPLAKGITIFCGLNNVGKTSLLRAMTGLDTGNAGPYVHQGDESKLRLIYELEDRDRGKINSDNNNPLIGETFHGHLYAEFSLRSRKLEGVYISRPDGPPVALVQNSKQYSAENIL